MSSEQTKFLDPLIQNLKYLESRNGETIVVDGKFIGPGQKQSQNMVQGTTISRTGAEANEQSLFEDSLLGKLEDNLDEDQLEGVVDLYIKKIVDGLLEGM
jgi:hypothetical protein